MTILEENHHSFLIVEHVRDLFNKELSISEIARRTGHSRRTVRKYLVFEDPVALQNS
jgi:DNA invertase Pin-like site-specific DNA recombinase